MSRVYILIQSNKHGSLINGVVSNEAVAARFVDIGSSKEGNAIYFHRIAQYELDDPELLNRIAKESRSKIDD